MSSQTTRKKIRICLKEIIDVMNEYYTLFVSSLIPDVILNRDEDEEFESQ